MKNILLILVLFFSISNYGQYNSVDTTSKKETRAYYLKNILPVKDDSFFDQTLIRSNPIKKCVNIKNAVLDKMTIYDTLGRLQKSLVFLNNTEYHTIDLSELSKGVYFVVLENKKKTAKRKIIIN
ncbi:T9SS type A sorting domain-containing protein [Flavobacterium pectinovorum]|uniref:T9SS type A sorting domain-containing protein n=1 Tax=Flavobacterium pectinovorum TaxID=29533 RepID=UPI001FAC85AF|nr:T9SS type A sorting domain-containing protein [Flavobacterium pectinovorum]MCI9845702.1 T9SS type A sorting domain-containing protein [Flavobacterium pectinovorum]